MTWANRYVGLPFEDRGRGPDGYDCWGLVRLVYQDELGISLDDYLYAGLETHQDALTGALSDFRRLDGAREWALVLMSETRPHIGVCVNAKMMLHTRPGTDACVVRLNAPAWRPRIVGFYEPN